MPWPSDISFLDIIDHAGDAVFIADAETGMLLYGNRKARDLTGWNSEEIASMHQSDLHPREEREAYRAYFKGCRDRHGFISKGDRCIVTRNGTKVPVEICATTLEVNGRNVIEAIFRDISDRRVVEAELRDIVTRLGSLVNEHDTAVSKHSPVSEEASQRLDRVKGKREHLNERCRTIFYAVGIPILIFDGDETIVLANREFERISGCKRKELEDGKNWMDFVAADDIERLQGYRYGLLKNRATEGDFLEFRFVERNGKVKPAYITLAVIPGSDLGLASIIDGTKLRKNDEIEKQTEEKLRTRCLRLEKANEELLLLLKFSENEKAEVEGNILANVKELIMPYVAELKRRSSRSPHLMTKLNVLEAQLRNILSPFSRRLTQDFYRLSPREMEVANLIREGKTTKDIMDILHVSKSTIDLHRHGIRKKLDLTGKKSNLRSFLLSLQ